MPVIKRNEMQKIIVVCPDGQQMEIQLVRIKGSTARIGIDAPSEYRILRPEHLEAMSK